MELAKRYDPEQVEVKWYSYWEENRLFQASPEGTARPYCIVIPPPNVTGSLHIGHALNNTLQDILIRFRRMDGWNVLWQPGTDHAGIATQNVVENQLRREGIGRHQIGREKFIERVWRWKQESGNTIVRQLKRLGSSCDWSRERFTMDEGLSRAVVEVFVKLYEEGLIFRGNYIINWCPRCHTALSDLEVEYIETKGRLYHIRYPFEDGSGQLVVATTRPESMLGDTAVAVNPEDPRFRDMVGKKVILPLMDRRIPVIADSFVDMQFGTGAVKITPAHDPNDFEIGRRHGLPEINVMNEDASMNENAGVYRGLDRYDCRKRVLDDLKGLDLLHRVDDHLHAVGHCYRCRTVVEPYLSRQWFVKVRPLAEEAIRVVREGRVKIVPKHWENTYFEWMENIRDWCISRQIWWGHRIPAWTCTSCGKIAVARTVPGTCPACDGNSLEQETDVLDTWFSSALWPFSTLGWPEKTKELAHFYPTSVLVTAFDILFFWVARMIMMGLKFMGEVPFHEVYIHALVRDAEGKKMSKSKGNVIDPLEIMFKYGTDSLRFTLAAFAVQGRDIKLSEERIEGYRNFVNKLWNASRFTLMNLEGFAPQDLKGAPLEIFDRWILSRLQKTIRETREGLTEYRFNDAANILYQFIWHEFCDWYIEAVKPRLSAGGDPRAAAQAVLTHVLETLLRLLHPMMPFVTEEIWQHLPHQGNSIVTAPYPIVEEEWLDPEVESEVNTIIEVARTIRNIRSETGISPAEQIFTVLKSQEEAIQTTLRRHHAILCKITGAREIQIDPSFVPDPNMATGFTNGTEVFVSLGRKLDLTEEKKRLEKELKKLEEELEKLEKKLASADFLSKAPEAVVAKNQDRRNELAEKAEKVKISLSSLTAG